MPALVLKVGHHKLARDDMFPKEQSAQKGPTCWYYAARLIREFHDQTHKWNPQMDNSPQRRVEREISAVRKMQTQLDTLLNSLRQSTSTVEVANHAGALFDMLERKASQDPNFRARIVQQFPQIAGQVVDPKQSPKGEFTANIRQAFARKQLKDVGDQLWLAAIFGTLPVTDWQNVYAQYGFQGVALDTMNTLDALRTRIETHGPLLCIGDYALQNYSTMGNMIEVGWYINKVAFDYIYDDQPQLQNGLHAIVVCGVANVRDNHAQRDLEIVVYMDPNQPYKYFGFNFNVLLAKRGRLHGGNNVFFLACGNASPCQHTIASKVYK